MRYFGDPAEGRVPNAFGIVLRTFGTANWTQFCPRLSAEFRQLPERREATRGMRLSFFVVWNVRECWFFDIYIQGSKKVQL
jgi:hypothetical protein